MEMQWDVQWDVHHICFLHLILITFSFFPSLSHYLSLMMDGHDVDDPSHKETVYKVETILQAEKEKMQSSSISQFWLQYMTMVDILKMY